MNPFAEGSWLWRAWRGRSVTFATLFALSVLGVSALTEFRAVLDRLGAPWYVWFLAPIVLVATLAKKEQEWLPDPNRRRQWSRWIVIGSVGLAIAITFLTRDPEPSGAQSPGPAAERK